MTATGMSQTGGSDWSCSGTICTRTTPMPAGETDTITLTVGVSYNISTASNGAVNNVSLSGGGISGSPVAAQDTQTVQPGPGYMLTTSVSPTSSGTVTANPTNSTGDTAGHYTPGTPVTLTATAATGYIFSSWTGSTPADLSSTSTNPTTVTMNAATETVTATFTPSGAGTVTPASGGNYNPGTVVSLKASPQAGYVFSSWTGAVASSTSASTTITMSANESVTANFTERSTKLNASLTSTTGPLNARQWTFSIGNTGPGATNAAQISSLTLTQNSGTTCTPRVTTPFPINLGNLAP